MKRVLNPSSFLKITYSVNFAIFSVNHCVFWLKYLFIGSTYVFIYQIAQVHELPSANHHYFVSHEFRILEKLGISMKKAKKSRTTTKT